MQEAENNNPQIPWIEFIKMQLEEIKQSICGLSNDIKELVQHKADKDELLRFKQKFEAYRREVEEEQKTFVTKEQFSLYKTIILSACGTILLAVLSALVYLVVK